MRSRSVIRDPTTSYLFPSPFILPGARLSALALGQELFKEVFVVAVRRRRLFQLLAKDVLHGLEHVDEVGPSHHLAKLGEGEAANLT